MMLSLLCSIAWLSSFAFCQATGDTAYAGYIEGEALLIAPREAGRIVSLDVSRGSHVEKGALLFRIEDRDAADALTSAKADLVRLQSELADLKTGKRPEEIAVTRAQLSEAEAAAQEAERDLQRQTKLLEDKVIAQARLDQAKTTFDQAEARVVSLRRQIDVETMAARADAIKAAESRVAAQAAVVEQAKWRLGQRSVRAPVAGLVEDTLRRPGEMASPEAAVVSLLPPENRILRFFVPEAERALFAPGDSVALTCDGCAPDLTARVSYVAPQAEFTPPVIYSVESRQKLVYLIEARPEGGATSLLPGQIVDVRRLEGGQ